MPQPTVLLVSQLLLLTRRVLLDCTFPNGLFSWIGRIFFLRKSSWYSFHVPITYVVQQYARSNVTKYYHEAGQAKTFYDRHDDVKSLCLASSLTLMLSLSPKYIWN
uniref:Secreted protein n=1 Tax=Attheya septentrionalis TaxID=420275 RepID=A0A7S2UG03_9STRA